MLTPNATRSICVEFWVIPAETLGKSVLRVRRLSAAAISTASRLVRMPRLYFSPRPMASRRVSDRGVADAWPEGTLPTKETSAPFVITGAGPLGTGCGAGGTWPHVAAHPSKVAAIVPDGIFN